MSDSDEFRTSGQELARRGPKALLPGWLQALGESAFGKLAEYRDNEYRRAFWDLLAAFGATENEDQAKERLATVLECPRRTHDLLGYLNDLTFEVHDLARPAYLKVAAESLARKISSEVARDVGLLLRRASGREISMLKKIAHASKRGPVSDEFKNPLNPQQLAVATRVVNRLIDAGLATPLSPSPGNMNPGAPQWGCSLVNEDHRRESLQRYATLLKDAL